MRDKSGIVGRPRNNLRGKIFNFLSCESFSHKDGRNNCYWNFKCTCGNIRKYRGSDVKGGDIKSCGCMRAELSRRVNTRHGFEGSRFYKIWSGMKGRCTSPGRDESRHFKYYKGKGIKVCKRWYKFENFRDDMYESYLKHCEKCGEKNTQIDRINGKNNYTNKNCRWVTCKEQNRNRSCTRFITFKGVTKSLGEWMEEYHLAPSTINFRLSHNWPIDKLFNKPRVKSKSYAN